MTLEGTGMDRVPGEHSETPTAAILRSRRSASLAWLAAFDTPAALAGVIVDPHGMEVIEATIEDLKGATRIMEASLELAQKTKEKKGG